MAKYVPDIKSKRWVVISPGRVGRPSDKAQQKGKCVFCPGNESATPPEVLRFGKGAADKPGWQVRVVPNKFPITDLHEVIIHSPSCKKDIEDLKLSEVELVFKAYRERFVYYKDRGRVLIFCNHGFEAGASLTHPHSQLVVIPFQINLDTLERQPVKNILIQKKYFTAYCPEFSQWPFEVWVAPLGGREIIFGSIREEEIKELARITQSILQRIKKVIPKNSQFAYNYYIHHGKDWYLRIMPRLVSRAGFELGTGLYVNVVDPAQASRKLQ